MTSKTNAQNQCFVYIMLPGQTEFVTAGKLSLEKTENGVGLGRFVYGKSYLARTDAAAIDPVELKLTDKEYTTVLMNGVFGAIRDALPDSWGRKVIDKKYGISDGRGYDMLYLLEASDDRIGALRFGETQNPPAENSSIKNHITDLAQLQQTADEILQEESQKTDLHIAVEQLLRIGTSMGGARPKTTISDNNALWLAKFNTKDDRWNYALAEHAMLALAKECGLNVADSRIAKVADKDVLLIKRFDREGDLRHRMVSALTVLQTDDNAVVRKRWSYLELVEELRKFSETPTSDAHELFKRMVFNALISNTDDHPRNHAFIAADNWRLSPAYDLTPTPSIGIKHRDLALVCGNNGRFANRNNLLSECRRFMLNRSEAVTIIDTMADYVKNNWQKTAKKAGLSEYDCDILKSAFVYPGFFY